MRGIALPFVFQNAEGLIDRQKFPPHLLLECEGLAKHLGMNARTRFGAMSPDRVTRAGPGKRDQHRSRNDDSQSAEHTKAVTQDRRRGTTVVTHVTVLGDLPLLLAASAPPWQSESPYISY